MLEIERKYLIDHEKVKPLLERPKTYKQCYLSFHPHSIRITACDSDNYGKFTIKTNHFFTRKELEYKIPLDDAKELFELAIGKHIIHKTRYHVLQEVSGKVFTWEVDQFHDELSGLWLAELELEHENQEIFLPEWVVKDVTNDQQYYNAYISENGYQITKP